ncbi:hypothetical protein VitviT2T_015814 [Vitis vinifera]|uniref:Cytochrome b6-f complex subunit 6 n=1 Tax=Vitis vinifera TaxID=29760 RepID=A0ABY9CSV4_VITVI|nr:hypothetical protein VitviT2T_015814 [Vitis vinifera]
MLTITSYFGFLLAASTITPALFIGLSKIRVIRNSLNEQFIKINVSVRFQVWNTAFPRQLPILVFLFRIVLGLIPITLAGFFVTAYLQDKGGDQLDL